MRRSPRGWEPIHIGQFTIAQCLLDAEEAPGRIFLRDGPLDLELGEEASVTFQAHHAGGQIYQGGIKILKHCQMAHHLTGRMNFPAKTASCRLPGELGGPMNEVPRTS